MKKPKINYKKIYRTNPETGAYIIGVSLDKYEDLFNEWDPAPFKRKDMDPDLRQFLSTCETDIPDLEPIELCFELPESGFNQTKEENAMTGLANYFEYEVASIQNELRRINKRTAIHLLIAIALLSLTTILNQDMEAPMLFNIFKEGVTIGAWVFTWEAISTFFFGRIKIVRRKKQWMRLSQTPITFKSK